MRETAVILPTGHGVGRTGHGAGRRHWQPVPGQSFVVAAFLLVILMTVIGLAVDGGQLLLTRRALQASADAAAFAGAQQIDLLGLRAGRQVRLDTTAATTAAYTMLAADGIGDAAVAASPERVEVVARALVRPILLPLPPVVVEAAASAVPRSRITP